MDNRDKTLNNNPNSVDSNTSTTNNNRVDELTNLPKVKSYTESKYDKSSQESNATFFEKFERTKKDLIREKKQGKLKAQKSVKLKNKILGFENKLRDDEFIKHSWIAFISFSVFFIVYASICLGFLATSFNGTTDPKWSFAQHYGAMTKTIVIFSSIVIILVPMPYIYLMGMWFVGINGAHKSKGFFVSNFIILLISLLLILCVIPMSSVIFEKVNNFVPFDIPVSGGDSGTGGDTGGGEATQSAFKYITSYYLI